MKRSAAIHVLQFWLFVRRIIGSRAALLREPDATPLQHRGNYGLYAVAERLCCLGLPATFWDHLAHILGTIRNIPAFVFMNERERKIQTLLNSVDRFLSELRTRFRRSA